MKKIKYLFLLLFALTFFTRNVYALDADYVNSATGYKVYIIDEYNLLSDQEERRLLQDMIPITEFGNAAFVSVDTDVSTPVYAKEKYKELFGYDSGSLFVIDMGNRNIWIHSNGKIYKTITKAYANTITDNVYTYASKQQYYECAANVFRQEYTLLQGGKIAQPMKYITNAIISFIIAILGNFLLLQSGRNKVEDFDGTSTINLAKSGLIVLAEAKLLSSSKKRRAESSSSSYSGSSSSSSYSSGHSYSGGSSSSSHSSSSSSHSSGGGGGHKF